MNLKNILQTIVIAGILSVVVAFSIRSDNKVVRGLDGQQGVQGVPGQSIVGPRGPQGVPGQSIVGPQGPSGAIGMPAKFGGLASPDIPYNWFSFGGVRSWAGSQPMVNASTTCSIQSPVATSTLVSATFITTTAPTTTPIFEIGNSTSPNATTTLLARWTFTANQNQSVVATSTSLTDTIINPSTYVNVKQGGGGGSFVPGGTCKAVFREV